MSAEQEQENEITGRPTWDEYFSEFAFLAATRSHDSQTKVGCVFVHENRIISIGYNGFCSGVTEENLPVTRPHKYPYMVHAEENAVSNMIIKPRGEIIAYITHMPCQGVPSCCGKIILERGDYQKTVKLTAIP